jgi:hypothetical protein
MGRKKTQVNKIRNEKGEIKQTPRKSRESSGSILKNYIQINWKSRKNGQISRYI